LHTSLLRQLPHPGAVGRAGVFQGVLIANLCEMVVAWIGVAALAVGEIVADGMIGISLNALHAVFVKQGKDAVRMRAESTEIAEAIDGVHAAPANVPEGGVQGQVIAVHAPEDGDPLRHRGSLRSDSRTAFRTDSTCSKHDGAADTRWRLLQASHPAGHRALRSKS